MSDWARVNLAIATAISLGKEQGRNAASWYFDSGRNTIAREDYLRVLKGLRDGDPMILDSLPQTSPLSGEMAGDMTPDYLMSLVSLSAATGVERDAVCDEYEQAFSTAVSDDVEHQCLIALEREVTFTLRVMLRDQDVDRLLGDLEDHLVKKDASLLDTEARDADTDEVIAQ